MDPLAKINQTAPAITLIDLEGKAFGLDQARADLLILNFWSAECPWSARADTIMVEMRGTWGDGVEIWSIASNAHEDREQIAAAAKAREVQHVFIDPDHAAADRYGALTTPHFFLLDQERIIRYVGALDDTTFRQREPTQQFLGDAVRALQAGHLPDPQETNGYGCTIVRYEL